MIMREDNTIDILALGKQLVKKLWIILLVGVLAGGSLFLLLNRDRQPQYEASVTLYVSQVGHGKEKTAPDQLPESGRTILIQNCRAVLSSDTVLEQIAGISQVDDPELGSRFQVTTLSGSELFTVTASAEDLQEAEALASAACQVLPQAVAPIHGASSVGVVDAQPRVTSHQALVTDKAVAVGVLLAAFSAVLLTVYEIVRSTRKGFSCR